MLPLQSGGKAFDGGRRALDFHEDPLGCIPDPSAQIEFLGEAIDEGTEADPLHGAADGQTESGVRLCRRRLRFHRRQIRRLVRLVSSQSVRNPHHSEMPSPVRAEVLNSRIEGFRTRIWLSTAVRSKST